MLLSLLSTSLTAGEKSVSDHDSKKFAAVSRLQRESGQDYSYTVSLKTMLEQPVQKADSFSEALRLAVIIKFCELGVSTKNVNVKIALPKDGLDVNTMIKEIATTQSAAGDGEIIVNVDLMVNRFAIDCKPSEK